MKKLSVILCSLLVIMMCLTPTAYAKSSDWLNGLKDSASNLWDKAKDKGNEIVETVKEEGPGWIETGKEKASQFIDEAGEVVQGAQEKVSDWNNRQQEEFWDRTEQMIGGGSTPNSPAPALGPVDENIQATPGSFDEELQRIQEEIFPSTEPKIPENIAPRLPVLGDMLALQDALEERQAAADSSSAPPDSVGEKPRALLGDLDGTLFYNGQWYRETRGNADVVYNGRAFARTDEVLLNFDTPLDDVIVLDGSLIQLSRSDYSVQEVKSTQPEQSLTDGDLSSSIVIAIIMTVVLCGLGVLVLIWQSKRRAKNQ